MLGPVPNDLGLPSPPVNIRAERVERWLSAIDANLTNLNSTVQELSKRVDAMSTKKRDREFDAIRTTSCATFASRVSAMGTSRNQRSRTGIYDDGEGKANPPTPKSHSPTNKKQRPAVVLASSHPQQPSQKRISLPFLVNTVEDGVILPTAHYRKALHAVLVFMILLDLVDVSLSVVSKGWYHKEFEWGESTDAAMAVWGVVEMLLFGCEVYLNTRTAILREWELLDSDRGQVLHHYFRTWMAFDVLTAAPLDLAMLFVNRTAFRVFRGLKVLRFVRIPTYFAQVSPLKEPSKLIEGYLFTVYCSASVVVLTAMWLAMATTEELIGDPTPPEDVLDELTYAIYFIITTLSSVGYGDLSPNRVGTQWFSMLVQVLGVAFLIYVGAVGTAFILETDPYKVSIKDRRRRLAALMEHNSIPWAIQKQCFAILPSLLESNLRDYNIVLDELPPFMQDKIRIYLKLRLISAVPLFKGASEDVLLSLVLQLRTAIIPPREYIIEIGTRGHEMFFISRGCVEVTIPDQNGEEVWVATLKDGSWFGEVALLCSTERTANVRAITATEVFVLDSSSFLSIVDSSPSFEQSIRQEVNRRLAENERKGSLPHKQFREQAVNPLLSSTEEINEISVNGTPSSAAESLDDWINGSMAIHRYMRRSVDLRGGDPCALRSGTVTIDKNVAPNMLVKVEEERESVRMDDVLDNLSVSSE